MTRQWARCAVCGKVTYVCAKRGCTQRQDFRAWTPAHVSKATRPQLIAWLVWNDPNGCYTDADMRTEFDRVATTEELRACALAQVTQS